MRAAAVAIVAFLSLFAATPTLAQQRVDERGASLRAPVLEDIKVPPQELQAMSTRFERALKGRVTLPLLDDLYGLPVERRIAWLRIKVEEGRSALFQYHLARNLWIMADARERIAERRFAGSAREVALALGDMPDEAAHPKSSELKAEAVRQALISYVAMRANSPLCRDRSSPDSYLHQLGNDLQPMLIFLAALDAGDRSDLVDEVLRRESRLNLLSRGDDLLCRRGIYGDRYCAPGSPPGSCPEGAAPYGEFMPEDVIQPHRSSMRRKARAEIQALGR
jgi:hypothetical protein